MLPKELLCCGNYFSPKDLLVFPIEVELTNAREGLIWVATSEVLFPVVDRAGNLRLRSCSFSLFYFGLVL